MAKNEYDYTDYEEQLRQDALATAAQTNSQTAQQPSAPDLTYQGQLADMYNKIQSGGEFRYDVHADPLYQQYKNQYVQQGKLAMRDTMGKAAGLTGGYGTSYGQQVGQQAYDAYLQNLSGVIPELYSMAFDVYQDKFNRQQTNYKNLLALIQSTGYDPTDEELAAAGLSREAATALINQYLRANGLLNTSGGGGGGGGRGGSGKTGGSTATTGNGAALGAAGGALAALLGATVGATGGGKSSYAENKFGSSGSHGKKLGGVAALNENSTASDVRKAAQQELQRGAINQEQYKEIVKNLPWGGASR